MTPDRELGAVSSDVSLAERIWQGDRAAENELVRLYSGRVLVMAMARMRDREAAREVVDDVMMAVVTALRRRTVQDTSRLGAFVHGTAVNLVNNRLRTLGRTPRMEVLDEESAALDCGDSFEREADLVTLRRCLDLLPGPDREVLTLSLVDGLKPGEIARRLGSSPDAVRQQKSRALKKIREVLDGVSRNTVHGPLWGR